MPVYTMLSHILAADGITNINDAIQQFISVFQSVFSFITSNWYFAALIFIPLGGLVVSIVLGFFHR